MWNNFNYLSYLECICRLVHVNRIETNRRVWAPLDRLGCVVVSAAPCTAPKYTSRIVEILEISGEAEPVVGTVSPTTRHDCHILQFSSYIYSTTGTIIYSRISRLCRCDSSCIGQLTSRMPSEMAKFETGPTKAVQCSVCNKKFSRTDHLKRHQLRRKDNLTSFHSSF